MNDPMQYDYIVVSRYDVVFENLGLSDLQINPGEIRFGARACQGVYENILASDILYAFSPKDLDKFINLNFENIFIENRGKIKAVEEVYTLFFKSNFKLSIHTWEYGSNFIIIR